MASTRVPCTGASRRDTRHYDQRAVPDAWVGSISSCHGLQHRCERAPGANRRRDPGGREGAGDRPERQRARADRRVLLGQRRDGEVDERAVGLRLGGDDDGVLAEEHLVERLGARAGEHEHGRRRPGAERTLGAGRRVLRGLGEDDADELAGGGRVDPARCEVPAQLPSGDAGRPV